MFMYCLCTNVYSLYIVYLECDYFANDLIVENKNHKNKCSTRTSSASARLPSSSSPPFRPAHRKSTRAFRRMRARRGSGGGCGTGSSSRSPGSVRCSIRGLQSTPCPIAGAGTTSASSLASPCLAAVLGSAPARAASRLRSGTKRQTGSNRKTPATPWGGPGSSLSAVVGDTQRLKALGHTAWVAFVPSPAGMRASCFR